MTDLKLVPKPSGFELRDKRSDKTNSSADWGVQDALYSVSQEIAKSEAEYDTIIIMYRKSTPEGYVTRKRVAGKSEAVGDLLLNGIAKVMGWQR